MIGWFQSEMYFLQYKKRRKLGHQCGDMSVPRTPEHEINLTHTERGS